MRLAPQKTCQLIIDTENHYLGALKGNQGNLHNSVQANFVAESSYTDLSKGHGRLEKRVVSLCTTLDNIKPWPGLKTLVCVESERHFKSGGQLRRETETRYYVASFLDTAEAFARRIRGYWGVENKVHSCPRCDARRRCLTHSHASVTANLCGRPQLCAQSLSL